MFKNEIETRMKNLYKDIFMFLLNNQKTTKAERQEQAKQIAKRYFNKLTLSNFRLCFDLMEQQRQVCFTCTALAKQMEQKE